MRNPFTIVKGKFPTQKDYSEWSHDKWMDFLRFLKFYVETTPKGDVYKITIDRMREMEFLLHEDNHPFHEHIWRINLFADKGTPRQFYYKLNSYARMGLTYIKRHPGVVSKEMEEELGSSNRFSWALVQYKTNDSNAGELVQRDTQVLDGFEKKNVTMPSLQAKLMTSMIKLVDIYEDLAGSITKQELKKLDTKDKLGALAKLAFVFSQKHQGNTNNQFTQININGGVKDAEKAMLDFVKRRQN